MTTTPFPHTFPVCFSASSHPHVREDGIVVSLHMKNRQTNVSITINPHRRGFIFKEEVERGAVLHRTVCLLLLNWVNKAF